MNTNLLYKKVKIGRLVAVTHGLLDFVYLSLISGTTNFVMNFSVAI